MGFVTTGKPLVADHPFFLSNSSGDSIKSHETTLWEPRSKEEDEELEDGNEQDGDFFDAPYDEEQGSSDSEGESGADEHGNTFFESLEHADQDG